MCIAFLFLQITHLTVCISGELGVMLGQWEGFVAEALNEKLM